MKYKIAILLAVMAMTGCDKTKNDPVEVRVVGLWTQSDVSKVGFWDSTYQPHMIVETMPTVYGSTKQRFRVFGDPPLGATGEVFCVSRRQLSTL